MFIDTPGSAHPRSRGENIREDLSAQHDVGSSPLTRGKRTDRKILSVLSGLIPAHAGKTPGGADRPTLWAAHPRSRGENAARGDKIAGSFGSSPLTRGKRIAKTAQRRLGRLIPAHAGKTNWPPGRCGRCAAHPRSRGENLNPEQVVLNDTGSSPLTRGKHRLYRSRLRSPPAHPRSRGENHPNPGQQARFLGSSPLTRGKRRVNGRVVGAFRLIPAHAGKTALAALHRGGVRAHPRSRGENSANWFISSVVTGSSPLTRGKREGGRSLGDGERLIPAHAGKTPRARSPHRRTKAHPRSRGENTSRPALLLRRSIRSWKPLSLPSPLEVTQFGSLAQLTRRRIRFGVLASSFRVVGAHHECESIEVNGLPWVSPRQEGESLLVARPVDHDGTSGLHVLSDDVPQALAYTGAERPHEDPRGNLHEPPRHVTSQPLGHRGQDQDDHQESLSS